MRNGLPSLTVPRHTTKTTIKKLGPQAAYGAKSGWSYGLEHASARLEKYLLENASCPTAEKNGGSAKSTAKYKEPSSSPFPGNFQLSPSNPSLHFHRAHHSERTKSRIRSSL